MAGHLKTWRWGWPRAEGVAQLGAQVRADSSGGLGLAPTVTPVTLWQTRAYPVALKAMVSVMLLPGMVRV